MADNNNPDNAKPFRFGFTAFVLLVVALWVLPAFDPPRWVYVAVGGTILVGGVVAVLRSRVP